MIIMPLVKNNQNEINEFNSLLQIIGAKYKHVPMDLNSSPLQDYFLQESLILNDQVPEVSPKISLPHELPITTEKTQPVLIPRPSRSHDSRTNNAKKNTHNNQRRLSFQSQDYQTPATASNIEEKLGTVSSDMFMFQQQKNTTYLNEDRKRKRKISETKIYEFTVGSLHEKIPVPWPAAFTTKKYISNSNNSNSSRSSRSNSRDSNDCFLADNRNGQWIKKAAATKKRPTFSHRKSSTARTINGDDYQEQDIFNMDSDYCHYNFDDFDKDFL